MNRQTTNTTNRRRTALAASCLLLLGGLAAACGDDDDTTAATDDTTTTVVEAEGADTGHEAADDGDHPDVVEITAVDYGFEGLPDMVPAGTRLSLTNDGNEPHELVAMRIPDTETRSVEELLQLPQPELMAILGADAEPATVILSAHGTTDTPGAVVGDGTLTEPGRYAIVCFLPVGSDDSILDPEADGPPESDAPPHITQGMFAELVVE